MNKEPTFKPNDRKFFEEFGLTEMDVNLLLARELNMISQVEAEIAKKYEANHLLIGDLDGHIDLTATIEKAKAEARAEDLAELKKVKFNHVEEGNNINHNKDELYTCIECYNDGQKKAALNKCIKALSPNPTNTNERK